MANLHAIIPPPPGVTPNYVDPYSLQRYDILCQIVCLTVSTLLVCMRLYTKVRVLRRLGSDDCRLHHMGIVGIYR